MDASLEIQGSILVECYEVNCYFDIQKMDCISILPPLYDSYAFKKY